MAFYTRLYFLTVPVFFALDMIWLGLVAVDFYQANLRHLLATEVNWPAAILFYAVYIGGILFYAVRPVLETGSGTRTNPDNNLSKSRGPVKASQLGALFGFFTYATYDLTNLATLAGWPVNVVVVDIAWGMILCALVAGSSCYLGQKMRARDQG